MYNMEHIMSVDLFGEPHFQALPLEKLNPPLVYVVSCE